MVAVPNQPTGYASETYKGQYDTSRVRGARFSATGSSQLPPAQTVRGPQGQVGPQGAQGVGAQLPEVAATPFTAAVVASNLPGWTTRLATTLSSLTQPLPLATAGGNALRIVWAAKSDSTTLTLTTAGSDVIGEGAATSFSFDNVSQIIELQPVAGRWCIVSLTFENSPTVAWTSVTGRPTSITPTMVFTSQTGTYLASPRDYVLAGMASSAWTLTLPAAPPDQSRIGWKIDTQAAVANVLTVACSGSDVFNRAGGPVTMSVTMLGQAGIAQYNAALSTWVLTSDDLPINQLDLRFGAVLNTHLIAWFVAGAYQTPAPTYNANSAMTTSTVRWPDGSSGVYTADTLSTVHPGLTDGYHITYVPTSGRTWTVTQPTMTRDANGAVTAQPTITVT